LSGDFGENFGVFWKFIENLEKHKIARKNNKNPKKPANFH
jgi:hypothetical protein